MAQTGAGDREPWREQRRLAAAEHAAAHERRLAEETGRARGIVEAFVREARERGLRAGPLTARPYAGRGTYHTGLVGWTVRRDGSLGIGTGGEFYILSVAGGLRARLSGAVVEPCDPPLVVGAGGRDGDSMPLDTLLRRRLDAGDDWP